MPSNGSTLSGALLSDYMLSFFWGWDEGVWVKGIEGEGVGEYSSDDSGVMVSSAGILR